MILNFCLLQEAPYQQIEKEWSTDNRIDDEELEYVTDHVLDNGAKYKGILN